MSIKVDHVDEAAFKAALAAVRSDADETNWMAAGHPDLNPNQLTVLGSGSGGVDEMLTVFDPSQVQYGYVRVTEKVEISTTVKFVFVTQLGEKVGFVKRGRFGVCTSAIKEIFGQYHVDFDISNPSELTARQVSDKVSEASNTKTRIISDEDAAARTQRGFTANPTAQSSPHLKAAGPKSTMFTAKGVQAVPKSTTAAATASEDVLAAIKRVRADADETTWVATSYNGDDIKQELVVIGEGTGDVTAIHDLMEADKVVYALLRSTDVYDGVTTVKFIFISHIGDKVGIMKKAKLSTHKGAVQDIFNPFHIDFYVADRNEVSVHQVASKVGAASGSKSHLV